jgi:DNA polymerase (family 10)
MDLPPELIGAAKDAGVKFAIDTDAHSLTDLAGLRFGVAGAMIGGLAPADVINAWPLEKLTDFVRDGRARR